MVPLTGRVYTSSVADMGSRIEGSASVYTWAHSVHEGWGLCERVEGINKTLETGG